MKRLLIAPLIMTLLAGALTAQVPHAPQVINLATDTAFPVITMPDSQSGALKSIADFRGEKLMLQIFASW